MLELPNQGFGVHIGPSQGRCLTFDPFFKLSSASDRYQTVFLASPAPSLRVVTSLVFVFRFTHDPGFILNAYNVNHRVRNDLVMIWDLVFCCDDLKKRQRVTFYMILKIRTIDSKKQKKNNNGRVGMGVSDSRHI